MNIEIWCEHDEEEACGFSSFFSLSRDKVKNGKIEAARSGARANEIRLSRIRADACERRGTKLIIRVRCTRVLSLCRFHTEIYQVAKIRDALK